MYGHNLYQVIEYESTRQGLVVRGHLSGRMYVWSSRIARVSINRVRLPVLLVVSLTGKTHISLSRFAPEESVLRDGFDSPVSRQPAHLHTQAESGAYLRDDFRGGAHLFI